MRNELHQVDENRRVASNHKRSPSTEVTIGQDQYMVPFTLSREEETVGMELARSHLTQLMTECAASSFDESSWTRVNKTRKKSTKVNLWEKRSVKAKRKFKNKRESVPCRLDAMNLKEDSGSVTYSVRSTTTVNAPLNMVLKTLDASVTTAYRSFTKIIYGNLVADTSVLFHSSTPSTDCLTESNSYESLAVRWLVCRCSSLMVSDCDFCLQEYTKRHSIDELAMNSYHYNNHESRDDHDSRKHGCGHKGLHADDEMPVAYKIFRSMETRHCPELLKPHQVVRCKVPLGGFLLYPTGSNDKTAVVFYMSIAQDAGTDRDNRSGNSALNNAMLTQCSKRQFRALQSVVRQMALQIGRLDNAVESYNIILHHKSLSTLQWVCNAERSQCVVCCHRFHQLTRRRHHCRMCGEVICSECSVHKDVDLPTFGLTLLRICTSCNQTHSSTRPKASIRSELEVSVSSQHSPRCQASLTTDYTTEKSKLVPVTLSKDHLRQHSNLRGEHTKSVTDEKQSRELAERKFAAALESMQRLNTGRQASSCSKPAQSPAFDRQCFAKKWDGTRVISTTKTSTFTTTPDSPKPARAFRRSFSETFLTRCYPRSKLSGPQSSIKDDDKFESLVTHADIDGFNLDGCRTYWKSPFTRACQIYPSKNDSNDVSSLATGSVSSLIRQQDRPWIHRNFETPQLYEDIFLKLCENAAFVRNVKYVVLTLFTHSAQAAKDQQDEVDVGMSTVYYVKVKGSAKLMKVAANLRCCDPVLQMQKSLVTRNTWALDSRSALHPSGYDFRQLPIVLGPQQARFYAGVPLTDTKKRYRYGALAVFDSKSSPGEDDDLPMKKTLQALEVCACEAVMAVEERRKEIELRTFLQAPLIQLRQSEPVLHVSMHISQTSLQFRKIESIDGDSDDNDVIDEDYRFQEYEARNARTNSSPEFLKSGNSSVKKARVDYIESKMQELVRQAHDTQAQMVENTLVMERHGVPIV